MLNFLKELSEITNAGAAVQYVTKSVRSLSALYRQAISLWQRAGAVTICPARGPSSTRDPAYSHPTRLYLSPLVP